MGAPFGNPFVGISPIIAMEYWPERACLDTIHHRLWSPEFSGYLEISHIGDDSKLTNALPDAGDAATNPNNKLPLVVDLDGTLLKTDTLHEMFVAALFHRPVKAAASLFRLGQGRPAFKAALYEITDIDFTMLPVRTGLLDHLRSEKQSGRAVHLVTAADQRTANETVEHLNLFASVTGTGTSSEVNLKGADKRKYLQDRFPDGFAYAGDSAADLDVFSHAESIILVGKDGSIARRARELDKPIEKEFLSSNNPLHSWFLALRPHQWFKNLLVFVPLLLAGNFSDMPAFMTMAAVFMIFSVTASATYIINDLSDLADDRKHPTKRNRPFANGDISLLCGLAVAVAMILIGLVAALKISGLFLIGICLYLVLTLAYSFRLKQIVLLDTAIIAFLFVLRLQLGVVLAEVPMSNWLLPFSAFFFFSLALAKRHSEILQVPDGKQKILGRGYYGSDAPLTLALGISAAMISLLILLMYVIFEAFPTDIYSSGEWLWAAPLIISVWLARIWLLAHRKELDDDPVTFAIHDKTSIALGCLLLIMFAFAI